MKHSGFFPPSLLLSCINSGRKRAELNTTASQDWSVRCVESKNHNIKLTTWMSQEVSKWVVTCLKIGYTGVITHLLTIYYLPGTSKNEHVEWRFWLEVFFPPKKNTKTSNKNCTDLLGRLNNIHFYQKPIVTIFFEYFESKMPHKLTEIRSPSWAFPWIECRPAALATRSKAKIWPLRWHKRHTVEEPWVWKWEKKHPKIKCVDFFEGWLFEAGEIWGLRCKIGFRYMLWLVSILAF